MTVMHPLFGALRRAWREFRLRRALHMSAREFAEWERLDGLTRAHRYDAGEEFAVRKLGECYDGCDGEFHFLAHCNPRGIEDVGSI